MTLNYIFSQVGWGCNNTPIASLQRGKTPSNKCSEYETKQSDVEAAGILEF